MPNTNNIITQLQQTRLILTATPGRSGTQLLSNLLNLLPGVTAEHEPAPYIDNVYWRLRSEPLLARKWLIHNKIPTMLNKIKSTNASVYIETSHMLCKGFFEPLLDLGLAFDLIILTRDPRAIAMSMYYLNDIPMRSKTGRRWYVNPDDSGVMSNLPKPYGQYTDYQLCYWYVLEMTLLQKHYYNTWSESGQTVARVDLEDLLSKSRFREFLSAMRLPEPPLAAWHDYKLTTLTKYNTKSSRKAFMRSKGFTRFVPDRVPEQEELIRAKINYEDILESVR